MAQTQTYKLGHHTRQSSKNEQLSQWNTEGVAQYINRSMHVFLPCQDNGVVHRPDLLQDKLNKQRLLPLRLKQNTLDEKEASSVRGINLFSICTNLATKDGDKKGSIKNK